MANNQQKEEEWDVDHQRLARTTREAGEHAFGIVAVEVWVIEDEKLLRPKGGWWIDYDEMEASDAVSRLEADVSEAINPGVDVPGILWYECKANRSNFSLNKMTSFRSSNALLSSRGESSSKGSSWMNASFSTRGASGTSKQKTPADSSINANDNSERNVEEAIYQARPELSSQPRQSSILQIVGGQTAQTTTNLVWRDLVSIAQDPDSPKTARIGDMVEAGLDKAAGIPFYIDGHRAGVVIYYAQSATENDLLSSAANKVYLNRAANMIGYAYSMCEARKAVIDSHGHTKKSRKYGRDTSKDNKNDKQFLSGISEETSHDIENTTTFRTNRNSSKVDNQLEATAAAMQDPVKKQHMLQSHVVTYCRKCRGGNLQVPPPMNLKQTALTIFGAFCGLLVLSSMNEGFNMATDEEYFLLIGPFGALMTLMYGLSSAPASQPRNAILGQAVSGFVSLCFTYIPESVIPVWVRRALGPAFAIGAMVKLGIPHPPAGAHAVLYASGSYNFGFYGIVILGTIVSVIPATLINNLSSKRQYPIYWKFIPVPEFLLRLGKKADEKESSIE